ncbi:MAG: hypothetical protein BWK80_36495 [Desulfobacteraceae bacterium IS3]|nr:MAG: hypothetical protein BWK80_36495 [Desulfobacteraceae bacterium IS3]
MNRIIQDYIILYIPYELRLWNFRIVKMNRKVMQSSRKVTQSFKIYLCETLRFTLRNSAVKKKQDISLRNSAVKKKAGFNCVTPIPV